MCSTCPRCGSLTMRVVYNLPFANCATRCFIGVASVSAAPMLAAKSISICMILYLMDNYIYAYSVSRAIPAVADTVIKLVARSSTLLAS